MNVTAACDQIYANLIIILSQQLLLLNAQHTPDEYKTTNPSLLPATHALSNFTQIMAIDPDSHSHI